jgi:AcrR family transcriptional regulator
MSRAAKAPSGVQAPLQRRSQATLVRIVTAAERLLVEEGADAMTVKAVMARAGVGPGSFYARFEGREALLTYLQDSFWIQLDARWREFTTDGRFVGGAPVAVAGEVVRRMVRGHSRHEARLRAALVFALQRPAEDAMVRVLEWDELVMERVLRLLRPRTRHEAAIRVALHQLTSGLRTLVLFPDAEPFPAAFTEEDLILHLTGNLLMSMGVDGAPKDYGELLGNSVRLQRTHGGMHS